jgi:hypothetical protein
MSNRSSASGGAGSRGAQNASGANNNGATGVTPKRPTGSAGAQGGANYRARRATAVRATQPARAAERARDSAYLRSQPNRARAKSLPWWKRGYNAVFATVGVVAAIIIVFVLIANRGGSSGGNSNVLPVVSSSVANEVTNVSPHVIDTVGTGGTNDPFQFAKGAPALTGSGGKPRMVYIGAEYCPYCAAERWSMVVALSRFGTFTNLRAASSSSTDTDPNTPTFSFYGATYSSPYVDFVPVEEQNQDQSVILQTPTVEQQHLLDVYDAAPYATTSGAIPFVDVGGQYVLSGAGYSPTLLQGWSRDQIATKLANPGDSVTKSIVGQANYITAAICTQTQNKPANVCSDTAIQSIEQQLPKGS